MQLFYAPDITGPDYTLEEQESKHCVRVLRLGLGRPAPHHRRTGEPLHLPHRGGRPAPLHGPRLRRRTRIRETPLRSDPRRRPDQADRALRVVPGKSHRGRNRHDRPPRDGPQRTPDDQSRPRNEGNHLGRQTIAQGLPPPTAGDDPVRGVGRRAFRGTEADRPLRRSPLTGGQDLPARPASPGGGEVLVLIGPEGDFTPAEIDLALRHGFREVTLGTQRLRTETAAVAAAVMVSVHNAPRR